MEKVRSNTNISFLICHSINVSVILDNQSFREDFNPNAYKLIVMTIGTCSMPMKCSSKIYVNSEEDFLDDMYAQCHITMFVAASTM